MNCTTPTRHPRAHPRAITPNAADDLPLPCPVLSRTIDSPRATRRRVDPAATAALPTVVAGARAREGDKQAQARGGGAGYGEGRSAGNAGARPRLSRNCYRGANPTRWSRPFGVGRPG